MAGALHLAQFLLQVGQFVSQPCGQLELQLTRGLEHLLVQVGDDRLEVVAARSRKAA